MNNNNYIPDNKHFLKRARNIRNELLNKTDRYFLIDYPIVIWTIVKKNNNYILLDSSGVEVFRRKENRKKEIYQYCEDNGIDFQEEF